MRILALILPLVALPALADDLVARNGKNYLRLQDLPCPARMAPLIPPEVLEMFRAAVAQLEGRQYPGCWAMRPDGTIFVRYEDGDAGLIPMSQFQAEPGI